MELYTWYVQAMFKRRVVWNGSNENKSWEHKNKTKQADQTHVFSRTHESERETNYWPRMDTIMFNLISVCTVRILKQPVNQIFIKIGDNREIYPPKIIKTFIDII